jgi:DNA-binding MarR family transcriptional regulator
MQPAREIPLPGLFAIAQEAINTELFGRLHAAGYPELRPTHACVFGTIGREGDRLTSLAERAGMTKQAVGEVVSELEEIGYVERVPDPSDGRAKTITLTGRGLAVWEMGYDAIGSVQERWGEKFGRKRVREMIELLIEIADDANAGDAALRADRAA